MKKIKEREKNRKGQPSKHVCCFLLRNGIYKVASVRDADEWVIDATACSGRSVT